MFSLYQRVSTVVGIFVGCLSTAIPLLVLFSCVTDHYGHLWGASSLGGATTLVPVRLAVENVSNRLGVEDYFMNRKVMLTDFRIDLDADFGRAFTWNTKQLFLYVALEYESEKYVRNEIVIWDKIVKASDVRRLSISNLKSKYPAVDVEDKLPGTKARITLYWNTMPHVGLLFSSHSGSTSVAIPNIGEKFQ